MGALVLHGPGPNTWAFIEFSCQKISRALFRVRVVRLEKFDAMVTINVHCLKQTISRAKTSWFDILHTNVAFNCKSVGNGAVENALATNASVGIYHQTPTKKWSTTIKLSTTSSNQSYQYDGTISSTLTLKKSPETSFHWVLLPEGRMQ